MSRIVIALVGLALCVPMYAKSAPSKKHAHHGLAHQTAHAVKVVGSAAWKLLY